MTPLLSRRQPATPEQQFWTWFAENDVELFVLKDGQEGVFARLEG